MSYYNSEGYKDPTAYFALKNIDEYERSKELIRVLRYIINNSEFRLINRIELQSKKTGKEYK